MQWIDWRKVAYLHVCLNAMLTYFTLQYHCLPSHLHIYIQIYIYIIPNSYIICVSLIINKSIFNLHTNTRQHEPQQNHKNTSTQFYFKKIQTSNNKKKSLKNNFKIFFLIKKKTKEGEKKYYISSNY